MQETDVKRLFASRLSELCDDMKLPPHRGRQTALATQFGVSPNAARKWLRGEGMPELDMAVRIADWAKVNVAWLLQGYGPKRGEGDTTPGELFDAVQQLPNDDGQQVLDFIRYKIERADGWFASERLARYMTLLDKIAKPPATRDPD